ncbi:unnamed protein product [Musa acuminata subsp. burmannicoides]
MGNHRFRLSDMMPSSWFYKLKDVGRSTRRQSIHNTMKRSHPHTSSPPRELAQLPRRSSYYVSTRERTEGFPRSPVNHKASDTHFPALSPRKTRANIQRKATESESPSYRDYVDRCHENSSTDDNTMGTMSGDLEVLSELKLPPILTKPIKDVHDDDAPDKTCVLREHRKRIGRRPEVRAYRTPRLAAYCWCYYSDGKQLLSIITLCHVQNILLLLASAVLYGTVDLEKVSPQSAPVSSFSGAARHVVARGRSLASLVFPRFRRLHVDDGQQNLTVTWRNIASSGIMIHRPAEDKMLGNSGASQGCPKVTSYSNSQESGDVVQQISVPKNAPVHDPIKANNSMIWERNAVLNQGYSGPFYRQEPYALPYLHTDFVMRQQVQLNAFDSNLYPINYYSFPVGNRFSYMPPVNMFSQSHPQKYQIQEFQYFVVIDFEATCDKDKNPHPQEIIEFPSVLVNSATGQLEAVFQTYVRPAYHQHLSDFCKELTGIQQIQVDRGVLLSEALLMHDKWLEKRGIKHNSFVVVTWSNWDCRVMLESECRFKKIRKPPYFNRWINLKVPFQEMFQGVRCNLKEAIQLAGLTWEGRAHCGLDDARNTARLLVHLMDMGFKFSITDSLTSQAVEFPVKYEPFRDLLLDQNHYTSKSKELVGAPVQFHPFVDLNGKERQTCCYCGVLSSKCVVRKPGPTQGRCFFGCGNWTAARYAVCSYFAWASP